ncbi:hypothetical protein ACFYYR_24975 [Streptomyces sp. NPDC001922]|uniref:hypothetical protein n=1 Tax=Streptomyces sp. NPDC001922 TaxID=3364624 RepID=UPI003693503D
MAVDAGGRGGVLRRSVHQGPAAAHSTVRGQQNDLELFCAFITDSRYGWSAACLEEFGQHPEGNRLILDRQPVPLPPPLDIHVEQLATEHDKKTDPRPTPTWLFRGSYPGRPMPVSTLQRRLNSHGTRAKPSRVTACLNLAQDLPPAVLASVTGMHVITAEQWHRRAAPDWGAYLAARRQAKSARAE